MIQRLFDSTGRPRLYMGSPKIQRLFTSSGDGSTYSASFLNGTMPAGFTFTRASSATRFNASGVREIMGTNVPRIDYNLNGTPRGLLIERTAINYLLFSDAPVNRTVSLGAGTYTLWVEGTGSATTSAGTAVLSSTGTATAGTPKVFNVTTSGTVNITVSGSLTLFQLENTPYPTSYIATSDSVVTRAIDQCSMNVTSMGFNSSVGTFVIEMEFEGIGNISRPYEFNDGTTTNTYGLSTTSMGMINYTITNSGGTQANINVGTIVPNTIMKMAVAWSAGDAAEVLNGGTVGTASPASLATGITTFVVGSSITSNRQANAWIRRIAYYNTRLPDAQLQALTA